MQRDRRRAEAHRIESEDGARPEGTDEHAAEGGTGHAERNRPDELVQCVGLAQRLAGHEVRDDRVEGRREERLARAVDGDQDGDVPQLERAAQPEDGHTAAAESRARSAAIIT